MFKFNFKFNFKLLAVCLVVYSVVVLAADASRAIGAIYGDKQANCQDQQSRQEQANHQEVLAVKKTIYRPTVIGGVR